MATDNENMDTLNIQDVLQGITPEGADPGALGAYLIFETVGNSTVVSVDFDGPGPGALVQLVTLSNITGVTLQDLLNNVQGAA